MLFLYVTKWNKMCWPKSGKLTGLQCQSCASQMLTMFFFAISLDLSNPIMLPDDYNHIFLWYALLIA